MGDVGEGAAVHEGGVALERLDQVGLDGILEQRRHGTLGVDVVDRDGLAVVGVGNDHAAEARLEVHEVGRQAEARHDLGGHGDVEAVLARHAVRDAAKAVDDAPELAVVHVDAALPHDAARVDPQGVALLDVVVEHRGAEVVGRADGMEVAREVEVDVLHGDDLGVSAAGGTALDAKHRSQGRLAQAEHGVLAHLAEGVLEADGRGGLALAGRRGVDCGDENELALHGHVREGVDVDLRLVVAIELELLGTQASPLGDLGDRQHPGLLGNLDVGLSHLQTSFRFMALVDAKGYRVSRDELTTFHCAVLGLIVLARIQLETGTPSTRDGREANAPSIVRPSGSRHQMPPDVKTMGSADKADPLTSCVNRSPLE